MTKTPLKSIGTSWIQSKLDEADQVLAKSWQLVLCKSRFGGSLINMIHSDQSWKTILSVVGVIKRGYL